VTKEVSEEDEGFLVDIYQSLQAHHPDLKNNGVNNLKKIKSLVHSTKIPVRLIYGEYDHIIRMNGGEKFIEGIEPYCHLAILPCGHQVLQEKNLETIVRLIRE